MALILPGPLVSDIRGRIGDLVFERNSAGLYARAKGIVTQVTSPARAASIAAMSACSRWWQQNQTPALVAAWTTYARNFPARNTWGVVRPLTAQTTWMRFNYYSFLVWEEAWSHTPPTVAPLPASPFTVTISTAADRITITMPPHNWPPAPQYWMLAVFQGKPVLTTRTAFNGPWRYAGPVDLAGPFTQPIPPVPVAFHVPAGSVSWVRFKFLGNEPTLESRLCRTRATTIA